MMTPYEIEALRDVRAALKYVTRNAIADGVPMSDEQVLRLALELTLERWLLADGDSSFEIALGAAFGLVSPQGRDTLRRLAADEGQVVPGHADVEQIRKLWRETQTQVFSRERTP